MFVCTLHTSVGTFQKLLTGKEIWRTLCKFSTSNFYGSKPDSLLFVFAEKPTSVEIIDKADVLQKDKPVTVRSTHLSAACVFSTEYKYVPTQGLNSFFTLIELSISIISKPPLVHGNTSRLGSARHSSQKTVTVVAWVDTLVWGWGRTCWIIYTVQERAAWGIRGSQQEDRDISRHKVRTLSCLFALTGRWCWLGPAWLQTQRWCIQGRSQLINAAFSIKLLPVNTSPRRVLNMVICTWVFILHWNEPVAARRWEIRLGYGRIISS